MKIRTVSLELMRQGTSHNQLISPLTPYLAQAGNNAAVTVHLPWEHYRFLQQLLLLRYGSSRTEAANLERASNSNLEAMGDDVARILAPVAGLPGNLSVDDGEKCTLTHLRLVFSAAELSMVPFEVARSSSGFPGEGSHLSIQPVVPLVMTREIRSATGRMRPWPLRPKVLFVWAAPTADVPWRAHLQALVASLRPWIGLDAPGARSAPERNPVERLVSHLTVLPRATLEDIMAACAHDAYTHVHFLAHGGRYIDGAEERFGLVLHTPAGGTRVVGADKLVGAVTGQLARQANDQVCFSCPAVVTLATCDSANPAEVVHPGASLAHALHEAGVPLVVGSQFPLSVGGSVLMTHRLYSGLLAGDDPRVVLHRVRHELHALVERAHDWASLVAYTSFPEDLSAQVTRAQYEAARRSIAVTNREIDAVGESQMMDRETLDRLLVELDAAGSRIPTDGSYRIEGNGLLGSKEKRKAQALFELAARVDAVAREAYLERSYDALSSALTHYQRGAPAIDAASGWNVSAAHWVLTQALAVGAALAAKLDVGQWVRALHSAKLDLYGTPVDRAWTHGSLLELYLLRPLLDDEEDLQKELPSVADAQRKALASADEVARAGRLDGWIVESTRLQLRRYQRWWRAPHWQHYLRDRGRVQDEQAWAIVDDVLAKLIATLS